MSVLEFKADLATAHAKSAIDPTRTSQAVSDRFSGSRSCERPNLYSRDLDIAATSIASVSRVRDWPKAHGRGMQFSASFLLGRLGCVRLARGSERVELLVMSLLNQGRTTMKLTSIALASAFALSSTFAHAYTSHHKYRSGVRTHSAAHSMNYGRYYDSYGQYYGNPNNRGGLVGGADAGIGGYGQYYGSPNNRGGWVGGSNAGTGGYNQYYGNPNNRGGLVGGLDAGTYRP